MGGDPKSTSDRGTGDRGTGTRQAYNLWGGQPVGPGLKESEDEIREAELTIGEFTPMNQNSRGYYYSFLLWDYAVGKHDLKTNHIAGLVSILSKLEQYKILMNQRQSIIISGHTSPSGTYDYNKDLALRRANIVATWLVMNSRVLTADDFKVTNEANWSFTQQRPTTKILRRKSRSVYIVLYLSRDDDAGDLFPENARREARQEAVAVYSGNRQRFYIWAIDNWRYLNNNRYCWEAGNKKDGMFFKKPLGRLRNKRMAISYLSQLYVRFIEAKTRLETEYTSIPGSGRITPPVTAHQQLARWLYLDQTARAGVERVRHFYGGDRSGDSARAFSILGDDFQTLILWIRRGRYGNPRNIWRRIDAYYRRHNLPFPVVK